MVTVSSFVLSPRPLLIYPYLSLTSQLEGKIDLRGYLGTNSSLDSFHLHLQSQQSHHYLSLNLWPTRVVNPDGIGSYSRWSRSTGAWIREEGTVPFGKYQFLTSSSDQHPYVILSPNTLCPDPPFIGDYHATFLFPIFPT